MLLEIATGTLAVCLVILMIGLTVRLIMKKDPDPMEKTWERVRAEVDEARTILAGIRTEKARNMAMIRHYGSLRPAEEEEDEPPENDEFSAALEHPIVRNIAKGAGVDLDKIADGDQEEIDKAKQILQKAASNTGPQNSSGDSTGGHYI